MRMINGKVIVLMPLGCEAREFDADITLVELRKKAEAIGCLLKHDDLTGMIRMVPRHECVRPAEDMVPKVVSIARFQRKECPKTFLGMFNRSTNTDGPSAA